MGQSIQPRFIREPYETYSAKRGEYMTSHQLIDYGRCPLLFQQKRAGLVPESSGEWYTIGRAAHTLICEGREQFDRQYLVSDGPENPSTGKPYGETTQKFTQWRAQQMREVLRTNDYAILCHLEHSVRSHDEAPKFFRNGTPEAVVRERYCGVPCQIRIDYWTDEHGIADLKTCDNLDRFEEAIENFAYDRQMAFYRAVLWPQIKRLADVHLIAVEKRPPFRCGVWHLSSEVLDAAERLNERDLDHYRQSESFDHWPTLYERIREYNAC